MTLSRTRPRTRPAIPATHLTARPTPGFGASGATGVTAFRTARRATRFPSPPDSSAAPVTDAPSGPGGAAPTATPGATPGAGALGLARRGRLGPRGDAAMGGAR